VVALVLLGPSTSRTPLITLLGSKVDWVTLHQGAFAVWVVVTGLHVLARLVPALRLTLAGSATRAVPGSARRAVVVGAAAVAAVIGAALLVQADGSWASGGGEVIVGIHAVLP
jgi:hypothetical protein